jgi:protein-S-isoprenylcysteine O-methyltransferase Ste14
LETIPTTRTRDWALRLKNAAASAAVVTFACALYLLTPGHREALQTLYGPPSIAFTGYRFMQWAAGVYVCLLTVYLLTERDPGVSKSLRFFRVLGRWAGAPVGSFRRRLAPEDRLAVLSTLLKSFFAPLMVLLLMRLCMGAWDNGRAILDVGVDGGFRMLFDRHGFWFLLQVILFLDVFFFTVGYLVESPRLGNEIRSVDPTVVGWAAALLCYPPFNSLSAMLFGAQASEFPQFENPTLHFALNGLVLVLMAGFASASVALGLKASNLTHRGIVARGPYAVIRHPAYTCKNIAWWIGSIPMVTAAFDLSLVTGLQSVASVAGVTLLYVLRALTEEDHLRRVDGDYDSYATRVRYRFVPGLI